MSRKFLSPAFLFIISLVFLSACALRPALKLADKPAIRDIGIPVRSVNWVRTHDGRDAAGNPAAFITMGQSADNLFVLSVNPETGALRQHISKVPQSNFPTATFLSRTGKLYVGGAYAGHLLCYDPAKDTFEDLGAISPGKASFPCGIDEDAGGRIWIGSYGTADLTAYDPRTGQFTRCGRMDDVDMYNYPLVNSDGTICNRIMMTRPHLVVYDPKTDEKRAVGPVTEKGKDSFETVRGGDGAVYIRSSLGNFRVQGFEAVPVKEIPVRTEAAPRYTYSFADADRQLYRQLRVKSSVGGERVFDLNYNAAGTEIFVVHRGPDGSIYGSSMLPLHLFRYVPATGELADLGKCSSAGGEAYSMANHEGKLYIASYPGAQISIYDPAKPYRYGTDPADNPYDLGRIDDISYRPRSALAGPLGRVWFASIPDYGMWGGPLSWYDPAAGKKGVYHRTAGDASCYTLAWLEKQQCIAVGTTIHAGTGAQPKVKQAALFLWNCRAEKKTWEGTADRPADSFNALLAGPDGLLYGTLTGERNPEIFVFDPEKKVFVSRKPLTPGSPLDNGLQLGPDGYIYGFTSSCLYRFKPSAAPVPEEIVREEDGFSIAGPIVGKDIYFARGYVLKSIRLFR
jgi:streptogramin lyase